MYSLHVKSEGYDKFRNEMFCLFKDAVNKLYFMALSSKLLINNYLMDMKKVVKS
jgi:hypothetical protein